MDENNPENLLINGTQLNSFYNSSYSFEINTSRATAVAESISGSSKSQLPIYLNNKYSKKGIKGKAKILSVIHIPNPNDKGNKHVPLILKKSNKIKVNSPIAACNFANPVQNEIEKLSQSLFNEEILNTDQIQSVEMSQSYFNNQYSSDQLENIYDSGFVNSFASQGEIAEISDGLDSNNLCCFDNFIDEGSSSGFETQAKRGKVMRLVSILKSNQPVQNTSSLVIEELESGETEVPLPEEMESSFANEISTESGVSFLSETFSPILTTEAYSSATDSALFETLPSLTDKEESSESEAETDAVTFVTEAIVHATGNGVAHPGMQISGSDEANASRTSELMTLASDDIPYNAEIEIDSNEANKSFEVNVTPTNNANKDENQKMEDKDVDELEFDVLKANSKRRLFLEKVDVEFCKAAQRKVRGIENYGHKGYNAVRIFNDVMKLIPDESPATIHALLIAFEHQVGPVLTHLRYIQRSREMMNARRESESSSRATDDSAASLNCKNKKPLPKVNNSRKQQLIATEEIQNKTQSQVEVQTQAEAQRNIPKTRKKKIIYNVDLELSDNYADDSDEDYVPGKDVTPKKKKRPKRRYVSSKRKTSTFEEVPIHETPSSAVYLNNMSEEPVASTSAGPSSYDPYSFNAEIMEDEKRIIRYNKRGSLCGRKRPNPNEDGDDVDGFSVFQQEGEIYKAEPVRKEELELVKFKKKRANNSQVVPPIQKFMHTYEGRQNFRYMTLTKH